jgi:hypothetical protein
MPPFGDSGAIEVVKLAGRKRLWIDGSKSIEARSPACEQTFTAATKPRRDRYMSFDSTEVADLVGAAF